jgi:hypothetical protein
VGSLFDDPFPCLLGVSNAIEEWVRNAPCVYVVSIDIVWDSQRLDIQVRSESVMLSHFDGFLKSVLEKWVVLIDWICQYFGTGGNLPYEHITCHEA